MATVEEQVRVPTLMQLHLMVEVDRLPDVVEEIACAVLVATGCDPTDRATRAQAVAAVEDVLRKYVKAFEFCGFAPSCYESKGYDPWQIKVETIRWPGW
jgi:hypothetical protein